MVEVFVLHYSTRQEGACSVQSALKTLGEIAGIAGITVGVLLIVFRDIIRKTVLKNLPPELAYRVGTLFVASVIANPNLAVAQAAVQIGSCSIQNVVSAGANLN